MTLDLAKKRPIVTVDDFVDTYPDPTRPRRFRAVRILKENGMLPLTYTNEYLPDLNILGGWLLWSGCISNYEAAIMAPKEYRQQIINTAKHLDLGMQSQPNRLRFGNNGHLYARLINLMGVPNGQGTKQEMDTKTQHKIELPPYLLLLIENYKNIHNKDKGRVKKILCDQCKIILFTRLRLAKTAPYWIELIKNSQNIENAENLAKQVIRMFNAVYPKIGFNHNSIRSGYIESEKLYYARIMVRAKNLANALGYYNLFSITLNKEYTNLGSRIGQKSRK